MIDIVCRIGQFNNIGDAVAVAVFKLATRDVAAIKHAVTIEVDRAIEDEFTAIEATIEIAVKGRISVDLADIKLAVYVAIECTIRMVATVKASVVVAVLFRQSRKLAGVGPVISIAVFEQPFEDVADVIPTVVVAIGILERIELQREFDEAIWADCRTHARGCEDFDSKGPAGQKYGAQRVKKTAIGRRGTIPLDPNICNAPLRITLHPVKQLFVGETEIRGCANSNAVVPVGRTGYR